MKSPLHIAIVEKKIIWGWVGFQKSYVIFRVGHVKCLRLLTRWVGGVKKGPKHAYVIFEWSHSQLVYCSVLWLAKLQSVPEKKTNGCDLKVYFFLLKKLICGTYMWLGFLNLCLF